MKKVLAAVLAIICVAGSMNCLPQNTDYSGSTSVITADAAEKTEEVTILAGKNAEKYKYTMADEELYTTSLKETKLNWVDATNGNTYAAYTLTITDNTDKAKLVDTYVIGLKKLKSTNLDVNMSDKVDYCSDIEKALSDTKNFKEGDPAIEAIKALFDSKTHQATVKYIADNACKESYLKTIDLSGIEYIGAGAFDGCRYITDITIPATVKYVGKGAFQNSGIKKLSVLNEMINIPDSFCSSTNLTDVTFAHPDYIRSIGVSAFASTPLSAPIFSTWGEAKGYEDLRICDKAFQNCTSIKNCEFSDNVTVAGKNSFDGCSSLLTLKVGKNTYGLDQYAFQNCTSLNSITFNDKLIGLGGGCFQGCTALKSVSGIPGTLEDWVDIDSSGGIGMGEGVFASCTSLIDVVLPTSITRIPPKTFSGCTKLTRVQLPEGLKSIYYDAFYGCVAMGTVKIPKSVNKITYHAMGFYDNGKINGFKILCYKNSEAEKYAKESDLPYQIITESVKISKGDVNGDSSINVTDIALIATHIKGIKALSSNSQKNADANGDGQINVSDIAVIASHIKGIKALK